MFATEMLLSRVTEHVSPEISSICTGKGTLCAAERLFCCMYKHMYLERKGSRGGVIALQASKRLLTTVHPNVLFEVGKLFAGVVALGAIVEFLSII